MKFVRRSSDSKSLLKKLRMIQSEKRLERILKSLKRKWLRIKRVVDYVFKTYILTKRF